METHKISEGIVTTGLVAYLVFLFATVIAAIRIPEGAEAKKTADFVAALYGSGFLVAVVCMYGSGILRMSRMIFAAFNGMRP